MSELPYFVFQPNFFTANIIIMGAVKDHIKAYSAVIRTALKNFKSCPGVEENQFETFEFWLNFERVKQANKLIIAKLSYEIKKKTPIKLFFEFFFSAIFGIKISNHFLEIKMNKRLEFVVFFCLFFGYNCSPICLFYYDCRACLN